MGRHFPPVYRPRIGVTRESVVPLTHRILLFWLDQRGWLFPWAPVCLAVGIATYFALPWEPPLWAYLPLAALALLLFAAARFGPWMVGPLFTGAALVALGITLAGARAHMVAAPVLDFRYYGPVEGRLIHIDRSASDALRLTLDRVRLKNVAPMKKPARVRISLHGDIPVSPRIGDTLLFTAHLSPPGGAVEPGGFDFRRHAWFQRLGAQGYTRLPVLRLEAASGVALPVARARMALSERVRAGLSGPAGAFAAAIVTGDRSAMGAQEITAQAPSRSLFRSASELKSVRMPSALS